MRKQGASKKGGADDSDKDDKASSKRKQHLSKKGENDHVSKKAKIQSLAWHL